MKFKTLSFIGLLINLPALLNAKDFNMFRWNENYEALKNVEEKSIYEKIKYVELDDSIYISLGGSIRERLNIYENDRFNLLGEPTGNLLLHRSLFHADLHISDKFRAFVEIGAHLTDGKNLVKGPFDEDKADITQAFFDFKLDILQLRVGRQELGLGSARLVGVRDGPNVRRSFDGVRLDTSWDNLKFRFFALNEVGIKEEFFDNFRNSGEFLWGGYVTKEASLTNIEFYYIGLDRDQASFINVNENETRHSIGTRIFGNRNSWDWNLEFIYQFGEFGDSKISAWTAASVTGFTFQNALWSPRIAISTNIASGDNNPTDGTLKTFNPLYPNLSYFEEAAILSPQNFFNIEPRVIINPNEKLSINFDWNFFWRLNDNDGVYTRGLFALPGTADANGTFVAHVPSVAVNYQFNKYVSLGLSYSYFFAQEVIINAGGEDINFTKVEITWKF